MGRGILSVYHLPANVSLVVGDPDLAEWLARTQDQKAIFDLSTFETIPTGGQDRMPWDDSEECLRRLKVTLPDVLLSAYDYDNDAD